MVHTSLTTTATEFPRTCHHTHDEHKDGVSKGALSFLMVHEDLTTWQWLESDEGEAAIQAMPLQPTTAQIAALRKGLSADQVRVLSEAARARVKARHKFNPQFIKGLIADIESVEMASSSIASRYKAQRFAQSLGGQSVIADLCCGIGGDSWGLRDAGLKAIGVDLDPVRAWMYAHNTGFESICGDALDQCPPCDAFHLDPARRHSTGKRTLEIDNFLPGPQTWNELIERIDSGGIKLNPGVPADRLSEGELEIISESGRLTQAMLWVGRLGGEHSRRATRLDQTGQVCTLAGEPWRPEESNPIDAYLGTLDPCLERADLVGTLLESTGLDLVHPGTGMVTADHTVDHPMIRWYRACEVINWNRKRVNAILRGLDGGVVEVRTRGGVIQPDIEQRALRGKGNNDQLSVLVYRIDGKVKAIIGEHTAQKNTPIVHRVEEGVDRGADE